MANNGELKFINFSFLNFSNFSNKYLVPFFFDYHFKDFYRYGGLAYDYVFDLSFSKASVFLDIGLKWKIKVPFVYFFSRFPLRYNNHKLFFWRELKFLIYNSYYIEIHNSFFRNVLFFHGYFPFFFYNFFYKFSFSILDNFSPIARDAFNKKVSLQKRWSCYPLDFDRHISFGLFNMFSYQFSSINFFRYFVYELFVVNDLIPSASFFVSDYDNGLNFATRPFFIRRFVKLFFIRLKFNTISALFCQFFFGPFYIILLNNFFLAYCKLIYDNIFNYFFVKKQFFFFEVGFLFNFYRNVFFLFKFFFIENYFFMVSKFLVVFLLRFFFFFFKLPFIFCFYLRSYFLRRNFFSNVKFLEFLALKLRKKLTKSFRPLNNNNRYRKIKKNLNSWKVGFRHQKSLVRIFFSNPLNTFSNKSLGSQLFSYSPCFNFKMLKRFNGFIFIRYKGYIRNFFFSVLELFKYNFFSCFVDFNLLTFYKLRLSFLKCFKVFFPLASFIDFFFRSPKLFLKKFPWKFFYLNVNKKRRNFFIVRSFSFLRISFSYRVFSRFFF